MSQEERRTKAIVIIEKKISVTYAQVMQFFLLNSISFKLLSSRMFLFVVLLVGTSHAAHSSSSLKDASDVPRIKYGLN
jgi:hypothetical protein